MKFCAIICEYNPFHNGHYYQIQESLKKSGCDGILCIMGGNFSQRGEPTILDKYSRAEMAIAGGATAVVQIPTYFCTATAEIFAHSAIKIATSFKNVTHISFGSECGDIRSLTELARFLNKEPEFYKSRIRRNLNDGYSLGKAKTHALQECINEGFVKFTSPEIVAKLLDSPNNILAIEYLRVLLNSHREDITPITIKKIEAEDDLDINYGLTTATAIRSSVYKSKRIGNISKFIPSAPYKIFSRTVRAIGLPDMDIWGDLALYRFRTGSPNELRQNFDVCEGIENKLITCARENVEYKNFLESCVSRRFTTARIQRITTSCLLSLRHEYTRHIYDIDRLPYIKLLAAKQKPEILASLNECDTVLVSRKQDALLVIKDPFAQILMYAEDKANNLYSLLLDLNKDQQKAYTISDIYQKPIFIK